MSVILSKNKLEELKKELQNLIEVERPAVIQQLVEARAQGDLSENADYDAARNAQAELESRIKELEEAVNKAEVIDLGSENSPTEVRIGSKVTFLSKLNNKEHTVQIVGVVEADPFNNLISNESPLAKAMLGKSTGMMVEVREAEKPYKIVIKSIE